MQWRCLKKEKSIPLIWWPHKFMKFASFTNRWHDSNEKHNNFSTYWKRETSSPLNSAPYAITPHNGQTGHGEGKSVGGGEQKMAGVSPFINTMRNMGIMNSYWIMRSLHPPAPALAWNLRDALYIVYVWCKCISISRTYIHICACVWNYSATYFYIRQRIATRFKFSNDIHGTTL